MPTFDGMLSDSQIAELTAYVRNRFTNESPWSNIGERDRQDQKRQSVMTISVNVNGQEHTVDVDPATPLLYVLREDLRLNAAKFGCGMGQCGACTVMVDGRAMFSCLLPIAALDGRKVLTVEGLGSTEKPSRNSAGFH